MSQSTCFSTFSGIYRPVIDVHLDQVLDTLFEDGRDQLQSAVRYSSLTAKSKRIRPLFAMASHRLFSTLSDDILPLCSALECVHTFSLIHDDLPALDDDDFRRGQASCHQQFDEATAVLAGDLLLNHAYFLISDGLAQHFDPTVVLKAIRSFATAIGQDGLIGGQQLDLSIVPDYDVAYLESIHRKKTGALIQAAFLIPALLHRASDSVIASLTTYADHLGLLFQITDDILDVTASKEALGKTPNKDMAQDKQTYVQLLGLDQAKVHAKKHAFQAQQALMGLSAFNTEVLLDFIGVILGREA